MSPLVLLQIVFITLKLCNVISWSWWGVMGPTEFLFVYYFIIALLKQIGETR